MKRKKTINEIERGEVAEMPEIAEAEMPAKNCRNACLKLQNAVMLQKCLSEIAECGNALGVADTKQWRKTRKSLKKNLKEGKNNINLKNCRNARNYRSGNAKNCRS